MKGNGLFPQASRKEHSPADILIFAQGEPGQASDLWTWEIIKCDVEAAESVVISDSIPRKQSNTAHWHLEGGGPRGQCSAPSIAQDSPITETCPAPNAHSSKLEKVQQFQTFVGSGGSHESLWVWNISQGPLGREASRGQMYTNLCIQFQGGQGRPLGSTGAA